jgi:acyl transferase domain-containing protein
VVTIDDLCHTAAVRRTHHDCRIAVTGHSKDELRGRLEALSANVPARGHDSVAPRVGFVFCGQGPQWFAMGRELLAAEARFRDAVASCDELLRPLARWSLLDELNLPEERSRLAETEVAQPALFAIQVGLAALWKSWGVSPDCVIGHSVGEIAALHVAGALDLPEAIRIVFHRGRIMQRATGNGRMAAVSLGEEEAADVVAPYGSRVGIGAVNGPRSVVLSGEGAALGEVLASLQRRDVNCRWLPVNYAFHSAQMAALRDELAIALGYIRTSDLSVDFISTVTGRSEAARPDATYFGRNMREPVRFAAAAKQMLRDCDLVVEIGPHPVLGAAIADCATPPLPSPSVFASLRRGRPERETMLQACAGVYAAGRDVNWRKVQAGPGQIVDLPSYPWQRRRHWIPVHNARPSRPSQLDHPLLGQRTEVAGLEASLYQSDSASAPAWLADHIIGDRVLVPAAAEMEAFLAAGGRFLGAPVEITGFSIHRPLAIQQDGEAPVRWQVVVKRTEAGEAELEWHASGTEIGSDSGGWRSIANATARPIGALAPRPANPVAAVEIPVDSVYAEFCELGARFGASLQCLRRVERAEGFARASIELPPGVDEVDAYAMHPSLIDAALQLCMIAIGGQAGRVLPQPLYLPLGADRIVVNPGAHRSLVARARARRAPDVATLVADIWIDTPSGAAAMIVEGMRFARAEPVARAPIQGIENLYHVGWLPLSSLPTEDADTSGTWLILADERGAAIRLAKRLRKSGARAVTVAAGDRYRQLSADEFALDPSAPEGIGKLFGEGGWSDANPLRAVIDCWPLDIPGGEDRLAPGERDPGSLGTGTALRLVQALATTGALASGSLVLATRGGAAVTEAGMSGNPSPRAAGLWGLAGVIAIEHPELRVRIVDLDPRQALDDPGTLYSESVHGSDARVAFRDGRRWAPRLQRYSGSGAASGDEPAEVVVTRPGTFDGIDLRPRPRARLSTGEVRLKVSAAGLNFRDVLLALGLHPGLGVPVGAECAGIVVEKGPDTAGVAVGDRMFGYAPASLATEAVASARMLAPIPPGMPAETAAALPVAFLTALYGLKNIVDLRKDQSVLIHAAAGGVGLAAVRIAKWRGAEIFATAGSEEKRKLLIGQGVSHVLSSRSLDFADEILALTQNRGVDVVLNSLTGDFIPAGLRSLARGGWFLELGKRDIWSAEAIASLRPDIRYLAYDLGEEIGKDPDLVRALLDEITRALSKGVLQPLPVTLFPLERVRDAMRFMAQARHVGKIVLTTKAGRASPALELVAAGTYWITGGLGGVGKETARWLARRGARHLVLSSRHADEAANRDFVAELSRSSVACRVVEADASDRRRMCEIFDEIRRSTPPLRGVIHAAGVLRDAALINQRSADANEIRRGKVEGAWILHELTRNIALDFFVLYSAAAAVLGAPGQGMYAAANAELDALAHFRHSIGLPATSVAWGPWGGAGMAAELVARGQNVFAARGLGMIEPEIGFSGLERLLVDGSAYGAVIPIDWTRFLSRLPDGADRAYYSLLTSDSRPRASVVAKKSSSLARLKAIPAGQRRDALSAELAENACHVIGLDDGTPIASTTPLREMGLDSLMAVELRNVLVRKGGQSLPATLLFDYPHLDALSSHLYRAWGLDFDALPDPAATAAPANDLADLSDAEAETLLLAELANSDGARRRP